jgi:hypothetical protein
MDLLTRLRAEVPARVSRDAEYRFRAELNANPDARPAHRARRGIAWRTGPKLALAAGLAAAVAAAIVIAVPRSPASHPTATPGSSAPAGHPATRASAQPGPITGPITVQELAYRAAAAALARPAVSPGQWIYFKTRVTGLPGSSPGAHIHEGWWTADGVRSAEFQHGKLAVFSEPGTGQDISYAELAKLPGDPRALAKYIFGRVPALAAASSNLPASDFSGRPASERWRWTFSEICQMFDGYTLPPKIAANLFKAIAFIPGVTAQKEAGGVAFSTTSMGTTDKLILDPVSYRVISTQYLFALAKGHDMIFTILARVPVSGPGVRP